MAQGIYRLATITTSTPRRKRIKSQQLAWGVMLFSFAVFCAIFIFVIVGLQYFFFQSRVPLRSMVDVPLGTATLVDADLNQTAVTKSDEMFYGSVLTTDTQSQASVSFVDSKHDNQLIASVTVENGSSLNLRQDSRPRFDLSSDEPYWLDFKDAYGEFDIFVPDNIVRPILIEFGTTIGPSARLTASGHYTLIAAGEQVQLINYTGKALLIAPDDQTQNVDAGQTASISATSNQFTLAPHPDMLGDAGFTTENVLDINGDSTKVKPQVWICNNTVQNPGDPMGTVGLTTVDGRPALRLMRGNGTETHGETQCWHGLGTTSTGGLDVSPYSSVSIRATFKIQSQSLSACGVDASECPLTLAMDYIPANGGDPVKWYHGFYAEIDPNKGFPLRCDSCSEQHEQINSGTWYTYEIRNLFETFAPQVRPKLILNMRFYASGHQYEVYVSQVVLLGDQTVIAGGS